VKPIVLARQALDELDAALQWYAQQGSHLPARLRADVERTLEKVQAHPEHGIEVPRFRARFWRTETFPYLIIYEDRPHEIYVQAIAHERRKPGYWRKR
jgi:plasmid stabilization system protein ParE